MRAVLLTIAGLIAFLLLIGTWAFRLTDDLADIDTGATATALGLAGCIIIGLIAGFLWLGRQERRRRE